MARGYRDADDCNDLALEKLWWKDMLPLLTKAIRCAERAEFWQSEQHKHNAPRQTASGAS